MPDDRIKLASVEDGAVRVVADYSLGTLIDLLQQGTAPSGGELIPAAQVAFLCPVERPPSIRDFMAFEEHVANCRQRSGRDVPDAWYLAPAFYFSNPASLIGPDTEVVQPHGTRALDFELEVACIIGRHVSDAPADDPATTDAITGFMLFNDWSARDLQMREMAVGLGPAKGKDFCISAGPWIVTPDELGTHSDGRWSCDVDALVNGRRVGGGDIATAHFGWNEIVARASENTTLTPGDILGSGTVGTGCLLELRELGHRDDNPWLTPGDVVELRGGPLGVLRNTITARSIR